MAILGPFDFSGGFSPGYEFTSVPTDRHYATFLTGMRVVGNSVIPRFGYRAMQASSITTATVTSLKFWNDTVNSTIALVAITSDAIPKLMIGSANSTDGTSSTVTFTNRAAALSIATATTFDSLNNILIGTGGSTSSFAPFKVTAWNANAAALGGSPPFADCVKQVNNFLFLARNLSSTTTQSRVYWSNVNDPETWTGTNILDFNKNDGEPIMALGSIGTDLFIFKRTSIGRLSTVTLTTSGAVTLGPLVTVIRGVGCAGPFCVDNIPNGNIVFYSYDGRFYEFDGSSLVERSRQPYPGPNVYNSGPYNSSTNQNVGMQDFNNTISCYVKVHRGLREVYIRTSNTPASGGPVTLIWDFERNIWQGDMQNIGGSNSFLNALCGDSLAVTTTGSVLRNESVEMMFWGDDLGNVLQQGTPTYPYVFYNGGAVTMAVGTSVRLGEAQGFVPKSICFEITRTQTSVANQASLLSFVILADFDTYTPSTNIYTGTAGTALPVRIVIPLKAFKQDAVGSNVFPDFLSVMIKAQGQNTNVFGTGVAPILQVNSFWLSDEVIR